MPAGPEHANRVAIVGASSLRGKELKQVLEDRNFPAGEIILLDESVMAGTLTEAAGEPTFIRELDEDSFEGARFAFFAGTAFDTERNWPAAQRAGATVIDLTGGVVASGRSTMSIPSLGGALPPKPGSGANGSALPTPYYSPPTPVIVACTLAAAFAKFQPERIATVLFPPVSERDQPGIEELESQTTNLLSFRPIEKAIFDAQVAFNLLSGYGGDSKPSMAGVRKGIVRDVTTLSRGARDRPGHSIGAGARLLWVCFLRIRRIQSAARSRSSDGGLCQPGRQSRRGRRSRPHQRQHRRRKRNSSRPHGR